MHEMKKHEKRPYFDKMREKYKKGGEEVPLPKPKNAEDFLKNIPDRMGHGNIVDIETSRPLRKDEEPAGVGRANADRKLTRG